MDWHFQAMRRLSSKFYFNNVLAAGSERTPQSDAFSAPSAQHIIT